MAASQNQSRFANIGGIQEAKISVNTSCKSGKRSNTPLNKKWGKGRGRSWGSKMPYAPDLLGAFLANVTTEGTIATSLGIAVGNTLEGFVGAFLVDRFARGRHVFDRPQDVLRYAVLAGMVSTAVSATLGVTSLALGGVARWTDYGKSWLTWSLGDAGGALVVAPLLVLWIGRPQVRVGPRRLAEAVADVFERRIARIAADRKYRPEGGMQANTGPFRLGNVLLQECLVRLQLDRQQIWRTKNARPLAKVLANTLFFGERIRHEGHPSPASNQSNINLD